MRQSTIVCMSKMVVMPLIGICVWFGGVTAAWAESDWQGAPACADAMDPERVKTVLSIEQQGQAMDAYGVYAERCNGMLYLIDLQGAKTMWPINQSWWFDTLSSADWVRSDDYNAIAVEARYVTGVGPSGARPFWARIQINRVGEAWVPMEPEWIEMPNSEPKFDGEVWVAENQASMDKLLAREFTDLEAIEVDFDRSRFVIASVWLTSGSMRITDVWASKLKDAYEIHYDTTHPAIGTTDMRHSVIYAVVPKDGLPVRLVNHQNDQGQRIQGQSGFLERGLPNTK